MTPSVTARLKKEFLPQNTEKTMSGAKELLYKKKLDAHLSFCQKSVVAESRLCALSFFLGAVVSFVERQPVKGRIIAFLVNEETLGLQKKIGPLAAREKPGSLFCASPDNAWEYFRFYATSLVSGFSGGQGPHGKSISEFITAYPSTYDALADRFVPVTE